MINPVHILDILNELESQQLIRGSCQLPTSSSHSLSSSWVENCETPNGDCHIFPPVCVVAKMKKGGGQKGEKVEVYYLPRVRKLPVMVGVGELKEKIVSTISVRLG